MLDPININLSVPICNCKKENITWGAEYNTLIIQCRTCKTIIKFTNSSLTAIISFKKPYPEGYADKNNIIELIKKE